jgi:hypothetical protein
MNMARTKAGQLPFKKNAHQERMEAGVNAWQKEMMACQDTTEACLKSMKPTSVD